jgi:CAAX prenyl protease-like protein
LSALVALATIAPSTPAQTPAARTPGPAAPTAYTLAPEQHAKAVAYSRARYRLHFLSVAWEILVLVLLIGLAVAPRFRKLAERVSGRRFVQALVFFPLLLLVLAILQLPVDLLGHRVSLAYGQSVQGWGSWLGDWLKGNLVGLAIAVPLLPLLYAIIRRSPRRWWLFSWRRRCRSSSSSSSWRQF